MSGTKTVPTPYSKRAQTRLRTFKRDYGWTIDDVNNQLTIQGDRCYFDEQAVTVFNEVHVTEDGGPVFVCEMCARYRKSVRKPAPRAPVKRVLRVSAEAPSVS